MVTGRWLGTRLNVPFSESVTSSTSKEASSGRYMPTGSLRRKRPSSYSIMTARLVMGFVIDAMRKIASTSIGLLSPMSAAP